MSALNIRHYKVINAHQMGGPIFRVTTRVKHEGSPEEGDVSDINYFHTLLDAEAWAADRRKCRFYTAEVETFSAQAVFDAFMKPFAPANISTGDMAK